MYVCHCRAVNDRTVQSAAAAGVRDVDDLERVCGAGGDCGGCHDALQALLEACAADGTGRTPELVG